MNSTETENPGGGIVKPLTIEAVDERWAAELRMIVAEARLLLPRRSKFAAQVGDLENRFNRDH